MTTDDRLISPPRTTIAFIDCQGAWLRVRDGSESTVVTLGGEIHAHNSDGVVANVVRILPSGRSLVLDMSGVDFVSVAGFHAVLRLAARCRNEDVPWVLIPGASLAPYLRAGSTAAEQLSMT